MDPAKGIGSMTWSGLLKRCFRLDANEFREKKVGIADNNNRLLCENIFLDNFIAHNYKASNHLISEL